MNQCADLLLVPERENDLSLCRKKFPKDLSPREGSPDLGSVDSEHDASRVDFPDSYGSENCKRESDRFGGTNQRSSRRDGDLFDRIQSRSRI